MVNCEYQKSVKGSTIHLSGKAGERENRNVRNENQKGVYGRVCNTGN